MAIIEPVKRDVEHPQQQKKYSSALRFWHWLNLLIILGSLITVALNDNTFDGQKNTAFIQQQLQKAGATVTEDQARVVSRGERDKIWQIHIYCGYTLAALLLLRLALEFFHATDQKLIRKIRAAYNQYFLIKKDRKLARHELFVKSLYAVFYLMLLIMAITGLCMAFEDDVPALKNMHFLREIHEFTMYLIIGFIIIHLAGVYLAEHRESKGIVSDMINGGRE
jgi:Ni/Fe-hydrogenase 1 B-type cytochrome subunit